VRAKDKDTADKYVDRPFNIRPLCLWAFLVAVTIVMCTWSIIAVGVWFALLIVAFFVCQFTKAKDGVMKFLGTSRLFFLGAIVLCLAVTFSFTVTTLAHTQQKSFARSDTLSGVVENQRFRTTDEGSSYMVLSSAKFGRHSISGRVIVFVRVADDFTGAELTPAFGERVELVTRLNKADVNDMNINSRVKYSASVNFQGITTAGASGALNHTVSRYTKNFLAKYLSPTNAELMYSMLFGDKSALDGELRDNFAVTGMAHVLAVSGMHVALIIGMLMAVLKVARVRRKTQFPIILCVLLFYCYLCDFVFPILRASIMFLIILANRIYLRNTDLLSSICAAGIVTLILFPYALISVSFQLSYACMVGIALFMRPTTNLLQKTIHPRAPRPIRVAQNFLIKGTALYWCTTVLTLPIVIKYFGYVPVFGIISNLFILPVLVLCFQIVVIAVVTWVGFPLLYAANYLIDYVRWGAYTLAKMPGVAIYATNGGYWFLFFFISCILMTRFVFMPRRIKYAAAAVFMCLYCIGFLL